METTTPVLYPGQAFTNLTAHLKVENPEMGHFAHERGKDAH